MPRHPLDDLTLSAEQSPDTISGPDLTETPAPEESAPPSDAPEQTPEPEESAEPVETPAPTPTPEAKTPAPTQEINPETGKDQYLTDPVPEGKPLPVEPQDVKIGATAYTCTISISCATILNNLDLCDPEKVELVPEDGWILEPVAVTFYEGESVFNVLQRTCKQLKIHMEFMNTPIYNSALLKEFITLEFDGELWLDVSGERLVPQLRLFPLPTAGRRRHPLGLRDLGYDAAGTPRVNNIRKNGGAAVLRAPLKRMDTYAKQGCLFRLSPDHQFSILRLCAGLYHVFYAPGLSCRIAGLRTDIQHLSAGQKGRWFSPTFMRP